MDTEAPLPPPLDCRASSKTSDLEKHFSLRIHRRNGTSKLLLGVTGHPPKIGSLKQIKVAQDEVLTIKVVDHPRRDEPAEAIEV